MPAEKNTALRIIVPLVIAIGGVAIVVAGYRNSVRQIPSPATASTPATPSPSDSSNADEPKPTERSPAEPAPPPITQDQPAGPATAAVPAGGTSPPVLRARVQGDAGVTPVPIGATTPGGADRAEVSFTLLGAGVEAIAMADYFETISKQHHYQVQERIQVPGSGGAMESLTSLAARAVIIDGQLVDLFGSGATALWREVAPGSFEAEIVDERGSPVLRITKRYSLRPDSFIIDVEQQATNLSREEVRIEWVQYGPVELHEDVGGYGLDMRRLRLGHLLEPSRDPSRQIVQPDQKLLGRTGLIERATAQLDGQVWPRPADFGPTGGLSWTAQTSRYFAFAVMPRIDPASASANLADPTRNPLEKVLGLGDEVYAVVRGGGTHPPRLLLQLTSAPVTIAPDAAADLSFSAYAGPLGRRQLSPKSDPVFGVFSMDGLVVYNLGGPCAWCTFQPLAHGMLLFLTFLHDYVVFDWALAIMILVVCVRTILHPLTRRSQIGLTRFSKQMQAVAPKQQKIREKYRDEPKRMQEEMVRLMKEEKVNYAGALGCLPMFLQMPIWIALYAMLYFSFDLRHAPGFYGVFQWISGGSWSFLGDLSVADHFVDFGRTILTIPLFGAITGINVLPLVLGVVFFIQQKYLTPPPTTAMSPEQEMQMKMMKVMTVFMFPVLMYNAPSGLAIYFITNSTLGIMESRWIRAHINELDKNPPKPGEPLGKRWVENLAKRRGKT